MDPSPEQGTSGGSHGGGGAEAEASGSAGYEGKHDHKEVGQKEGEEDEQNSSGTAILSPYKERYLKSFDRHRDPQREPREQLKDNIAEYRKEAVDEIESNDAEAYDFQCPRVSTGSQKSDKSSSKSTTTSLSFTVGGKDFLMDDPRTLSEIFREKFGEESAARVYGFSTESLDYLKAHPDEASLGPTPLKIPHNEILDMLNGFSNIYLAHEISVNPNFRLKRIPPSEDSIEFRVEKQMKKAFWKIFNENLKKRPPNYNQALSVFGELKESLLSLLLPHNHQMRNRINTLLEVEHIEACVRDGTFTLLDFQSYSDFIIDTLGQLCCPSRDQDVAALRGLQKPSKVFRGVMHVIEKMKLDMANFFIMQFRPNIVTHCVQYERMKLADYMEMEYRLNSDGLEATRKWLLRHRILERSMEISQAKAFAELLNYNCTEPFPETLLLDAKRCMDLGSNVTRLALIGAIILTAGALTQSFFKPLPFDFRSTLKKHMLILMPAEDMSDKKKFDECMERVAEQAAFIINEMTKKAIKRRLTDDEKETVRTCVREIGRPEHKIRSLLIRRILDHAEEVAHLKKHSNIIVPAGLSSITHELTLSIMEFQRLISHNRRVFGDIYKGILIDDLPHPSYPKHPDAPWDSTYVEAIELLRNSILPQSAVSAEDIVEPTEPEERDLDIESPSSLIAEMGSAEVQSLASEPILQQYPLTGSFIRMKSMDETPDEDEMGAYGQDRGAAVGGKEQLEEEEDNEEEDEEGDEEDEDAEKEEGSVAGPSVVKSKSERPAVWIPKPFVKPPRVRIPGARVVELPIPPHIPTKYLLKSGADGLSRLHPNIEETEIKKKTKIKKTVAIAEPLHTPRTPKSVELDEAIQEFNIPPEELLWAKIEKKELKAFCCGPPPSPPPKQKSDNKKP